MLRRLSLFILMLGILCVVPVRAAEPEAPFFTWAAMQRFWNKMCSPGLEIESFVPAGSGYTVNYGRGLVTNVDMDGERVRAVRIMFDSREEQGGGPLFLRAIHAAVRVGTYGWAQEKAGEAFSEFEGITAPKREFQWGETRFRRTGYENGMWEFVMEYLFP